ncbi:MAG: glutamate--tRNA ligase family protein [Breznakibacter sp.]
MPNLPSKITTRFAPTPSGYLHIGNVWSFALTWALAKRHHGKIRLRIDDIDNTRYRPEYVKDIFETLDFLGLDYDLDPRNVEEFEKQYSQQHRLERYGHLLEELKTNGKLYACNCSRSQINAMSHNGLYERKCTHAHIPFDQPNVAWRIKIPKPCPITVHDTFTGPSILDLNQTMPDFVVQRKDKVPAYQIASLADDVDFDINLIVRGVDLIDSTAAQLFLARELGLCKFADTIFIHHPLIIDARGEKLSKSKGDTSIHYMRTHGMKARDIWADLAKKAGIASTVVQNASDFADAFNPGISLAKDAGVENI